MNMLVERARKIRPLEELKTLFNKDLNKKEQTRLLKKASMNRTDFMAIMFEAESQGYTFSQYKQEVLPSDVNRSQVPAVAELNNDGSVTSIGNTSMTDGQIKSMITQRKLIDAKIFDKGSHWHCFYYTSKGLEDKESGAQGSKPHLHYISDKFGLSREQVVAMFKSGKCPKSSIHIGFYQISAINRQASDFLNNL